MKKSKDTFGDFSKKTRMTSAEKETMRAYLLEYQAMKPLPVRTAPLARLQYRNVFSRLITAPMTAIAAIILVFAGTGAAFAAQGALPGDLLYPVKVGITEKVEGALAFSDGAKASFETSLADRRLTEAETLAAEGKLSESDANELKASFAANTENAAAHIAEAETSDPGEAAVAQTKLAAVLSSHANILSTIATGTGLDLAVEVSREASIHAGTGSEVAVATVPAAASVRAFAPLLSGAASSASSSVSASVSAAAAETLKRAALSSYAEASTTLDRLSGTISASAASSAEASLASASVLIADGDAALAENDAAGASMKYRAALSATVSLVVKLHVASLENILPVPAFHIDSETSASGTQSVNIHAPGSVKIETEPSSSTVNVHVDSNSDSGTSGSVNVKVDSGSSGVVHISL